MAKPAVDCYATTTEFKTMSPQVSLLRRSALWWCVVPVLSAGLGAAALYCILTLGKTPPDDATSHSALLKSERTRYEKLLAQQEQAQKDALKEAVGHREQMIRLLLRDGWERELIVEDGTALTVKNNRAAVGSKEHGFEYLDRDDVYPVIAYRVNREKTFGYGIAGDFLTRPFPFIWIGKEQPPPSSIERLSIPSGRQVVALPPPKKS